MSTAPHALRKVYPLWFALALVLFLVVCLTQWARPTLERWGVVNHSQPFVSAAFAQPERYPIDVQRGQAVKVAFYVQWHSESPKPMSWQARIGTTALTHVVDAGDVYPTTGQQASATPIVVAPQTFGRERILVTFPGHPRLTLQLLVNVV
jgi:hypothetical protein